MTAFTISIQDQGIRSALKALAERSANLEPAMAQIGERMMEDTKRRFETSTGPDGQRWQANSAATMSMLTSRLGKGNRKKGGDLNSKGLAKIANKKPLIEHGNLKRAFVLSVSPNALHLTNTMVYAAIHQFGGTTGAGSWIAGANIPARPFLPIRPDGTLYPKEQATIVDELNAYLLSGL